MFAGAAAMFAPAASLAISLIAFNLYALLIWQTPYCFLFFAALFAKSVPICNLSGFMRKMCNLRISIPLYKKRCFPNFGKTAVNIQKM